MLNGLFMGPETGPGTQFVGPGAHIGYISGLHRVAHGEKFF